MFTKDPVEVTEPRITQAIFDTGCDQIRIESNNGGRIFGNNIIKNLRAKKHKCIVQTRATTKNKETRILMKSGWIKKHCVFLHDEDIVKGSDYDRFMKSLTGYKKEGGNKHDDAPDGMTILAEFVEDIGLYKTINKKTVDRRAVV